MQTHEWEALLDGTTPGPWTGIADENTTCITTPDGVLIDVDEHWSSCSEADVRLAAHAPAAVAEVIRLRRAFEELRDFCAQGWSGASPYTRGMKDAYEGVADDLTRILEGDTDEQH